MTYATGYEELGRYLVKLRSLFIIDESEISPRWPSMYRSEDADPDEWKTRSFFSQMSAHPQVISDSGWAIFAIDPDPAKYFYRHFKLFPIITSDHVRNESEYIECIHLDPGDSPADAISTGSNTVIFSSARGSLVYYSSQISETSYRFCSVIPQPFDLDSSTA